MIAASYPIMLIDEPEAFLHPPQARLLGRKLASESTKTQVVVATHSIDFLLGLLSGTATNVTVVRLTRIGDVNATCVLSHERIGEIWRDPLLAASNLLDGLFHRGVVLCEGDTDARFYSAVLEAALGDRAHDLFFTHCGGKARMPMVMNALRALDVPVVAIADVDLLREERLVKAMLDAQGGDSNTLRSDLAVVDAAVKQMTGAPALEDVRKQVDAILSAEPGPRLTRPASERIRSATKVDDGWGTLKRSGLAALPQGDASAAGPRLFNDLATQGISVVPVGEVERWHPEVPQKGPEWLNEVIARELHRADGPAREFVQGAVASFES